jgi:hypothetical protein
MLLCVGYLRAVFKGGFIQGCQMVCFQTKNPNLGKFFRASEKNLVYFMAI